MVVMTPKKNTTSWGKIILAWVTFILILQIVTAIFAAESEITGGNRQIVGKSNMTIYTSDVTAAGKEVPEEYSDEFVMIKFSDDEPIEGETIDINATVFNAGTRSASVTVYFYDGPPENNDLIGTDTLSVGRLRFSNASTPWDTTGEGEFHTIFVLIDPDDPANESDDSNNQASRDIVVNQIPIAVAGMDLELIEDETAVFNASGSSDTESDLIPGLIYTWTFNDPWANTSNPDELVGNNLTHPKHIFTNMGEYEVNLKVEDDGGAVAQDTLTVTVSNIAPVASANSSVFTAIEDEIIIFDASESWDTPSDKINLSYRWEFGDGTASDWTNETSNSHSYPNRGSYRVELTVRDDNKRTDSDSLVVSIENLPPIADAGEDIEVSKSSIEFNASNTWDTPSDLKKLEYYWNFDDGTDGMGVTHTHNYSQKGTYTVILQVIDDNGETGTDSLTVIINNLSPLPVIEVSEIIANEDDELFFNGSSSYDSDGEIIDYHWDFGDGVTGKGVSIFHTFTVSGDYPVTLTVDDDNNAVSVTTINVRINNLPPVAIASEFIEVYQGEEIIFDGSNSTDTPSDSSFLKFYWDFGDNTTTEGVITNHTYLEEGIYYATLTVVDNDGERGIHTIEVIIREILLTSIVITEHIEPAKCKPGENITVFGTVEFEFIKNLQTPDLTLAIIRIEIVETGASWVVRPKLDGTYSLEIAAPQQIGTYTFRVSITRLGILAEQTQTLTVTSEVSRGGSRIYIDSNTAIIVVSVGTVLGGLGIFTAGTDLGRYKYFTLLIPLYTRLHGDAVLDNFTRGRIYEHIRMNPGEHYRAIKKTLELSNGCLTYHLKVLETENYIKSRTDGMCKRFYPVGMKITKDQPNNIQELILRKISEKPSITQKELAQLIGIDVSTVNYHINMMTGAGIIRSEKIGRTKHYKIDYEIDIIAEKGF